MGGLQSTSKFLPGFISRNSVFNPQPLTVFCYLTRGKRVSAWLPILKGFVTLSGVATCSMLRSASKPLRDLWFNPKA